MNEVIIIDYGSQYALLIKTSLRKLGVDGKVLAPDASPLQIGVPCGIILSGSPHSAYTEDAPKLSGYLEYLIFDKEVPCLAICYGMQIIAQHAAKGRYEAVKAGLCGEYGKEILQIAYPIHVLKGLKRQEQVWMSHGDVVALLPPNFQRLDPIKDRKNPQDYPPKAIMHITKPIFGLQFHPEVTHTPCGMKIFQNFLEICKAKPNWDREKEFETLKKQSAEKIGGKHVLAFISAGNDSSVLAYFLRQIVPQDRLHFCYVRGLGPDEDLEKIELIGGNFHIVDARKRIYKELKGIVDPEQKRKAIAQMYSQITKEEIARIAVKVRDMQEGLIVAQGTIWPDMVESGHALSLGKSGGSAKIKTHHNTELKKILLQLGLSDHDILEPLLSLFKPDVRELGKILGVPERLTAQHPWPGPGYGIRFIGCQSDHMPEEKLWHDALICEDEMQKICADFGYRAWALPIKSTGVQGDARTYAYAACLIGPYKRMPLLELATQIPNRFKGKISRVLHVLAPKDTASLLALGLKTDYFRPKTRKMLQTVTEKIFIRNLRFANLYQEVSQAFIGITPLSFDAKGYTAIIRAVDTQDFMTASCHWLPEPFLRQTAQEILAKIPEIQLVLCDLTSKPPGTIEWE